MFKNVLITGASSGIGKASALELARLGYHVFAGVRNPKDGEALQQLGSTKLTPLIIDVTDLATIDAAREIVAQRTGDSGLYGLVNNAGILVSEPLEFIAISELRHQLEVNVIGQVAVTQAFLPALRLAPGRIVNISSVSGIMAFPFTGAYCASKFALEAITDSLRMELEPFGIFVTAIEPPFINTTLWNKAVTRRAKNPDLEGLYGKAIARKQSRALQEVKRAIAPEKVAAAVVRALAAKVPKTRYLIGRDAYLGAIAALLPDRLRDWTIRKRFGLE